MKFVKAMSKRLSLFTREKLNRLPSPEPSFFRSCLMLMLNFPDDVREHRLKEMAEKASGGGGGGVGEAEQEENSMP
ncbi:hypothetical protein Bca52824_017326 [Brassica carinata]|uniref:Uncharacterized protein n=1 Tax=Brassica carinata TaxID=52824 RepID=A0A8X7VME3_BRACI|nr:hypothetical protein Bca52824_017326 [Brassica carinata]